METDTLNREEWISTAIGKYESMLLKYAYDLTGNYTLAQDVVQDTFLKLCGADIGEVEEYLKPWLFRVCRNRAFDILRKERRMETLTEQHAKTRDSGEPSPYEKMEKADSISRMSELIDELPEKQREVVYLKFRHNMSYKEISDVASISVSNVGFILHTAIRKLRSEMAREV